MSLRIERPNGKTYNIDITSLFCTKVFEQKREKFSSLNVKFYDDLYPVWTILELPVSYESTFSENWKINNVAIGVTFRIQKSGSIKFYYVQILKNNIFDLRIYAPLPSDDSYASSYLGVLSSYNTYFCYDFNSKKYTTIQGIQAIDIINVSNSGYINLFKPYYYTDFFKHGTKLAEKVDPKKGLSYTDPTAIRTSVDGISMATMEDTGYLNDSELEKFIKWLNIQSNVDPIKPPEGYPEQNPDNDDDNTGQPAPDPPIGGDNDTSSDAIPDPPPLPNIDVADAGFVTIYNPSIVEIRQLAYFMWSGDFVDLIKKMFAEPFSALISLKLIYVPVVTGNSQIVWLGNVETGVSMKKVTQQFVDVDMGALTISEFFGSFADYAPYTKVQIFLPFIGYKDLNVDEVMNAVLHLRYRIDVYSGACIAFLTVTKDIKSTKLNSILYQFDGNCSMEIPFTSNDNSRYVAAILNATTQGALSLASSSSVSPPKPQDPFVKEPNTASFNLGSLAPVANGMLDILSVKPNVARSGSLAGAIASMGVKQPYVIIHRPIRHMPANYQKYYGIPLNLTRTLNELSGYTVVGQVFIESAGATDEEVQMITTLLRNGVIL